MAERPTLSLEDIVNQPITRRAVLSLGGKIGMVIGGVGGVDGVGRIETSQGSAENIVTGVGETAISTVVFALGAGLWIRNREVRTNPADSTTRQEPQQTIFPTPRS